MRFAITSKGDTKSNTLMHKMRSYLLDFDLVYDEEQPDIVISVGGDGTLLYAFHRYSSRLDKTAFVGVHTGHLGFYADWVPDEIEKLVRHFDCALMFVQVLFPKNGSKKQDLHT